MAKCRRVSGLWMSRHRRRSYALTAALSSVCASGSGEVGFSAFGDSHTLPMTIADVNFKGGLDNMVAACRHYMGRSPLVLALDQQTTTFLQSRGVSVVYWPEEESFRARLFSKNLRLHFKFYQMMLFYMERGMRVVYFDLDVFWIRNPLELDDPSKELLWEGHTHDEVLNFGFYIAKPSCIRLFQALLAWLEEDVTDSQIQSCLHLDVFALDYAVRGLKGMDDPRSCAHRNLEGCRTFKANQLRRLESLQLRWDYLPIRHFMHYTSAPTNVTSMRYIRLNPSDPDLVAVHLWGQAGSPDSRLLLACLIGFWGWDTPPVVSFPLTYCEWCNHGWLEAAGMDQFQWCTGGQTSWDVLGHHLPAE